MYSEDLSKALMEFFFATTVSAAIVETLAEAKAPLGVVDILASVRDIRRIQLPQTAIEGSLMILEEARIVSSSQDAFQLTEVGAELARKLAELRRLPGQ
jgi:hypothetical protein